MASKAERLQKQYEESIAKAKIAKSALDKIRRDQDRKEKIAARKARNHALFMVGGLAEIAGLLELDKGTLLGALVMISQVAQNPADQHTLKNWKNAGDALLAEREAARKRGCKPKPPKFPSGLATPYSKSKSATITSRSTALPVPWNV